MRGLFNRPITKLSFAPPAPRPGRSGLAIVLIVKNEARHIGEWARFHRAAGAAHVYAYDNGSTDGTAAELAAALGDRLTLLPWDQKLFDGRSGREIHNQVLAYAHALRNFGGAHRWMACIDADEFLVPKRAESLEAALAHLGDIPSVTLPWHNFGRNGHDAPPEGGIVANYTRRAADPLSGARGVTNFKTLVDATRVTALKVHSVWVDGQAVTWNDRGERTDHKGRADPAFYSAGHLQLNHYYTRSEQELAAKIARGSNQSVEARRHADRIRRNVANIEASEVEDRSAPDFLARLG
ncbi:glycosyltransferase family 92 protein [Rhodovulum sulfidophilum]|uniref:glycosyltransferase family 92 protein n=1 Tax=Rhodovulum sulfidophilum TaxID=35806 RepID=UPI0019296E92|nr:glycosyltransferase family 92 protein [Rhodovulum sulfidophilum]MBL3584474.1 glycosyltransferase family 92 protein [Rhodovulum sulfidophilum]